MGGLWVDNNLMSTIPGLNVAGEANFSDHGANRLGASALMQGLADGYFVLPYTIGNYLASTKQARIDSSHAAFKDAEAAVSTRVKKLIAVKGHRTVDSFHRELGKIMWENVGMARSDASLKEAIKKIPALREEFWQNVDVTGGNGEVNQQLENAWRVADFLEFAELFAKDALHRKESCGGHFRVEYQDAGEAQRDDENFCYAAAWEFKGVGKEPELHKEPLKFENVELAVRSYK
jgi:succinate dehydrogenase / fumarate reductase flavoprotein subunit